MRPREGHQIFASAQALLAKTQIVAPSSVGWSKKNLYQSLSAVALRKDDPLDSLL